MSDLLRRQIVRCQVFGACALGFIFVGLVPEILITAPPTDNQLGGWFGYQAGASEGFSMIVLGYGRCVEVAVEIVLSEGGSQSELAVRGLHGSNT